MKKTVFFGPFFGELGWEFAYWHGWVKKMCREKYRSYRKIAASYPGREAFYPDVDEFWSHPPEVTNLKISQRGYVTDCWINNLPKSDNQKNINKNIHQYADKLINKYKEKLPEDTIFYAPHKLNIYCFNNEEKMIGTLWLKGLFLYKRPKTISASIDSQIFEILEPTKRGKDSLDKIIVSDQKMIAVFPRHRVSRRPDKSWSKDKYDLLIEYLKQKYPDRIISILGAPGGCYYADGVPAGCIDLINIPEETRFDVHLAALKRADLACGSLSGAMRIAYASGCPTLEWGYSSELKNVKTYNCWAPFKSHRYIFWPETDPSPEKIQYLIEKMIEKKEKEIIYPNSSQIPKTERMSLLNTFRAVLREIIAKIFFKKLKSKKLKEGIVESFLLIN